MNFRGARALVANTWSMWLQHRNFFFLLAFGWMMPPLIALFVWSTAAGESDVGGLTRGKFVAYYLPLILVNQLTYAQVNWTVGDTIREGRMNTLLLRPIAPLFDALAAEVAGKVVYMAFVVPVTAVLALLLHPIAQITPINALLFVPALALTALAIAIARLGLALTPTQLMVFLVALAAGVTVVYAMLLALTALIFWSPGVLFTWLFEGVFQMARYPVTLYPGWLRLALTWAIPIAVITTLPAQALTGELTITTLLGGVVLALGLLAGASALFRLGLRRYASASS